MVYHVENAVRCRSEPDNFWYTFESKFCTQKGIYPHEQQQIAANAQVSNKVEELVLTLSNQQVIEQN